ncbi:uncharacterized protein LOC126839685 isoform X2 [Adelges cooleyi]|uniref:uncharacterized protein LOC126839685 isoform X2 n=1 Tax=Adelges cooleyi TaxID=133065 RepID=UPI00217FF6DE|nr:uncharacterized protein LOC126839685 isoform X2 [Adelges cooleyi]
MHFKCALIFCALYLLTSAWSTGLNSDQLELLQDLYKPYKLTSHEVSVETIRQVVENTFKMEYSTIEFIFSSDESDSMNLFYLLWIVVDNEVKRTDKIKKHFKLHNQKGYIYLQQLSAVFNYWPTINHAFNKKFKNLETDEYTVMNAVDFLLTMMDIKPKGRGLILAQIEMFVDLYEAHKTSDGINADASREVFQKLGIQIEDDLKNLFESKRSPEILLMDLIIVAAERNITVPKNEIRVGSVIEVVNGTQEFITMDKNGDGLLSSDEYAADLKYMIMSDLATSKESPEVFDRAQHYINIFKANKAINVAEYTEIGLLTINLEGRIESDDDD